MSKKRKYQMEDYEDFIDSTHKLMEDLVSQFKTSAELSDVPTNYLLNKWDSCFCFGKPKGEKSNGKIVGMPEGCDGHILLFGSSGIGKTSGVIIPTTMAWDGTFVVNDIKGDTSDFYLEALNHGNKKRPCIVFNPIDRATPSYDPFSLIRKESPDRLVQLLWPIVFAFFSEPDR